MSNEIPQWLNEKFFVKVLRTSQGDKNLTVWNFFMRSLKKELMSLDLNLQIVDISVAASANSGEQYASTIFKATVKYANKFGDGVTKLFIKLVLPKVNAFTDENSYDTGKKARTLSSVGTK